MEDQKKKNQQSNNRKGGFPRPRRGGRVSTPPKSPDEVRTSEFYVGARDILATPEILSPTAAPDKKVSKRRKGADKQSAPAETKSPTDSKGRKGRQKAEEVKAPPAPQKTKGKKSPQKPTPDKEAPQKQHTVKEKKKSSAPKSAKGGISGGMKPAESVASATKKASSAGAYSALTPIKGAKLRIIPLGGLNEIGKNMTVLEYGNDIIIVDCGIGFPDEDEMPGIDLVVPDVTYLESNRDRIRGLVITHGHEDHIGAIPYVLQKIDVPIYGTKLALGILVGKLKEHTLPWAVDLRCVSAGDMIRLGGSFTVEFVHVNHSIADACALAINTPLGMVFHTGDFKLDLTPIDGDMMDLTRIGELGKAGVLLMMCESTNAERPGHTPSEKVVGKSLETIFTLNPDKRIVIATFSSNVHRVQQIIDVSARHGRKVAVTGRSMINIVAAAVELGYMKVPDGVLIDISDIRRYRNHEITLITTGSQGEPMSALYRMAFSDHMQVSLGLGDLVVLSASAIPGNEKLVGRIINELAKMGVQVINDAAADVHVSGHACQEELKLLQGLLKPRYFMPVHGEYKHLAANKNLAVSMGVPSSNVFISDIGKVLEIDEKGARFAGSVPSGVMLVDGNGVGDVGNIVLRDRKHLSQDGLIVIVATVDDHSGLLLSGPDVVSRGFVYVRESEALMDEVKQVAADALNKAMSRRGSDWYDIKNRVKDDVSRFLYTRTKKKPMILPIIMEV